VSQISAPDPLDDLRRADPVDPDALPLGSEARLRARVMENTMEPALSGQPRRSRVPWPVLYGVGIAALVVAIVVGTGLLSRNGGSPARSSPAPSLVAAAPSLTPTPAPTAGAVGGGGGLGQCAFEFTDETLAARGWAFDGSVTAIEGNQATFAVVRWFRGGSDAQVTKTIDGLTDDDSLLGGPGLEVGGRYLVTGDDEFAWSCGFTQFWNADVAEDWARVFGA
jgi:hypothetical protein